VAYSAREAGERYGLSADTFRNLIKANVIAAKMQGTKYLIPVEELDRWFESLPDA
jgi:excisionase family DNA binding protein